MNSCLYVGRLRHRRFAPRDHTFDYSLFQVYLDLAELDDVFRGRWLWSTRRPAVAWFRRADHLGDPEVDLDIAVRDLVAVATGRRPRGPIRLLTHLRYFGYCMNPVSFYYCFDQDGARVETVVAEIHNTPWGERHCYVLGDPEGSADAPVQRFRFRKAFHVSPFMPMAVDYDWRFTPPSESLAVHMENHDAGARTFDATLSLTRRPMTGLELGRVLAGYPLMTVKVIGAIYWQALKLWWKGCRFHPHPTRGNAPEVKST